jgi:hypothetical protein
MYFRNWLLVGQQSPVIRRPRHWMHIAAQRHHLVTLRGLNNSRLRRSTLPQRGYSEAQARAYACRNHTRHRQTITEETLHRWDHPL